MNKQFIKLYNNWNDDKRLKPNHAVTLARLTDRMESSVQNLRFYDHQNKRFFVVYRHDQLAEDTHLSTTTIKRVINDLINYGYVEKKTLMNTNGHKINKYFLPKFVSDKSDRFKYDVGDSYIPEKFHFVQRGLNVLVDPEMKYHRSYVKQTSKVILTNDPKLTMTNNSESPQQSIKEQPIVKKDLKKIQLDQTIRTLTTQCAMPKEAVTSLAVLARNEPAVLAQFADQVFKAKSSAKNKFEKVTGIHLNPADMRFETNNFFDDLPDCIDTVVVNVIDKCKTLDRTCAYLFKSLKDFFLNALQLHKFHRDTLMAPAYVGPEIPMIDISDPNRGV